MEVFGAPLSSPGPSKPRGPDPIPAAGVWRPPRLGAQSSAAPILRWPSLEASAVTAEVRTDLRPHVAQSHADWGLASKMDQQTTACWPDWPVERLS